MNYFLIKYVFICLGSYNVTLAVNDVGGQTLGGAMLDKYIFGADVKLNLPVNFVCFMIIIRLFCLFMILQIYKVLRISKIGIIQWSNIVLVESHSLHSLAIKVSSLISVFLK